MLYPIELVALSDASFRPFLGPLSSSCQPDSTLNSAIRQPLGRRIGLPQSDESVNGAGPSLFHTTWPAIRVHHDGWHDGWRKSRWFSDKGIRYARNSFAILTGLGIVRAGNGPVRCFVSGRSSVGFLPRQLGRR